MGFNPRARESATRQPETDGGLTHVSIRALVRARQSNDAAARTDVVFQSARS